MSRQPGQGGNDENQGRDLRAELLRAEAAHYAKRNGKTGEINESDGTVSAKRRIEDASVDDDANEDEELKRRRKILEEAQDLDADSAGSSDESSDEEYVTSVVVDLGSADTNVARTTKTKQHSSWPNWRKSRGKEQSSERKRYVARDSIDRGTNFGCRKQIKPQRNRNSENST